MRMGHYLNIGLIVTLIVGGYFIFHNSFIFEGRTAPHENIQQNSLDTAMADHEKNQNYDVHKSEDEWRAELTRGEYRILRQKGTEMPYVNEYYKTEKEGIYVCAACGQKLFSSETKYHSGSGWPAFYAPIDKEMIHTKKDKSMFMTRTEVLCSRCGSHLGHVFEDGPEPTGLRYCINSVAMDLIEKEEQ